MDFHGLVMLATRGLEAAGVAVIVLGSLVVAGVTARNWLRTRDLRTWYRDLRRARRKMAVATEARLRREVPMFRARGACVPTATSGHAPRRDRPGLDPEHSPHRSHTRRARWGARGERRLGRTDPTRSNRRVPRPARVGTAGSRDAPTGRGARDRAWRRSASEPGGRRWLRRRETSGAGAEITTSPAPDAPCPPRAVRTYPASPGPPCPGAFVVGRPRRRRPVDT